MSRTTTGPYGAFAERYVAAGWRAVLPLPPGEKKPPPVGFTGPNGALPTDEQIERWVTEHGDGNVALRLPRDVIGIDVDGYDGRRGHETLAWFESTYGQLPSTWRSSSRSDGSGILLFRVPDDVSWVSDLGPDSDVQIVRFGHRYAVVAPSVHPETRVPYRWFDPAGEVGDEPPAVGQLPTLPGAWVDALRRSEGRRRGTGGPGTRRDEAEHVDPERVLDGVPIGEQQNTLFRYVCSLRARGVHRSEMIALACVAVSRMDNDPTREPWTAEHVTQLVDRVVGTYPAGRHDDSVPISDELRAWAETVNATPNPTSNGHAPLAVVVAERPPPPVEELATDTGNGVRLARVLAHRVRFLHGENRWLVWDGTRWRRDATEEALDLTKLVIADIRAQALRCDDADERNSWLRHAERSESLAGRRAMLTCAEAERGVAITSDDVDPQPHLLNCANGTLDLRTGELRAHDPRDLLTRCTSTEYRPDAESPLLNEFLSTFMPEPELADYLWRALGSTLLGGNTFRLLMLIQGGTTSGKSQLVDGVAATLGDYAVPIGTSVFRGNQDDKPRPDLLRALHARLAYAEEASQAWELHTDMIKRLTGGARLSVRGMNSNVMIERAPAFTPLIVTNEMPRVKGADLAVRRRMLTLHFGRSLVPGTEDVTKKLRFVADLGVHAALLARLVAGCRAAHREGLADVPRQFVEATMTSFDALTHVGEFIDWLRDDGQLVEHRDNAVPLHACWRVSDLHATYRMWIGIHGDAEDRRGALSLRAFRDTLIANGWTAPRPSGGARWPGKLPREVVG